MQKYARFNNITKIMFSVDSSNENLDFFNHQEDNLKYLFFK